jgi:APA family basic amino acid/polyamine antiporter
MAVNLTLIVLRYRLPKHLRPFRVPFSIGRMPLLPLAAIASILLLLTQFDWQIYLAGVAALALTVVAFSARQWHARTVKRVKPGS